MKKLLFMEAVSENLFKIKIKMLLWTVANLDLKSVSEDTCLRSMGKLFHNWAPLYEKLLLR